MKYLEIRRHTMRQKPGKHLTQAGVSLARQVGASMGPFTKVITSDVVRAFETAIAMGFAVDEQLADLAPLEDDGVITALEDAPTFAEVAQIARSHKAVGRCARELARVWTSIAESLPEEGVALVITHGLVIELGAAGCLPDADFSTWGAVCDYCEGIRLSFDGKRFVGGEVIRLSQTKSSSSRKR
ncbi:MAG: histidine phosphatase family protein [Anaerolineae bacterium]|nr:histidine phosphatase family protein [Thermoflexales bacterium]MDW8408293.1 histidine phosphatase family protein [Anaerolineae bacterium]